MKKFAQEIKIENKIIGLNRPVYFIADIASNHDGDLNRAKDLIYLCAEAGADAAKFQHFAAETIVSDYGFKKLGGQLSHQKSWKKPVFDVYKEYSINPDWTAELAQTCRKAGIAFMTSPYSIEIVDAVDEYVPAYKIGSGDITWHKIIRHIAKKGKPVILATGAAALDEVCAAVEVILHENGQLAILQCNTNYTVQRENFKYVNLNVLKKYAENFPGAVLGISDHTAGDTAVLGAIALGARVIEKHFTDDNSRTGPDHNFAMNPRTWQEMVERSRDLQAALGDGIKKIEDNEKESAVIQKRSLRFVSDFKKGHIIGEQDLFPLRPIPAGALPPYKINEVIGRRLKKDVCKGDYLSLEVLE